MRVQSLKAQNGMEARLATWIALVASTLTVLFVLVVGVTSYFVTRSQISQGVQNALESNATVLAGRLDSTLKSVVSTLSGLSQNALILNSLMDSLTRDTSLEPFLKDLSTINGIPVEIVLTDFEGNAVAGVRRIAESAKSWKDSVLGEGVPFTSIEKEASRAFLFVAEPIFYLRTLSPEGALIHRIDLSRLMNEFSASPGGETVRLLHNGRSIVEDIASEDGTEASSLTLTKTRRLDLPESFRHLALAVEVTADAKLVSDPLDQLLVVYLFLGIGLLAGVILVTTLAGRRLALPLRELEQVAAAVVASGSVDHRFEGGGYTEVTRLGQTFNQMLVQLGAAHKQLTTLAHHDPLTGLANRTWFQMRLKSDLHEAKRCQQLVGILLLDLDDFKGVNDTLGHPVGDELLKQIAERLVKLVRTTDTVARLGGDEFAVIGTHLDDARDAAVLGQKIITTLAQPFRIFTHDIFASASIGIAIYPSDGNDGDELLSNADLALYKAKSEGREHFQFYDLKLNTAAQKRKSVEASIRTALEKPAFCLHYQPRVNILTGEIAGAESLVRWQSENGLVYPDEFITVAEESRLIVPLGEWVLRESCLQAIAWEQAGLARFPVAVNLSAVQLRRKEDVTSLMRIIDETGIDPGRLEIEITESALMENVDSTIRHLAAFQAIGVRLAIDDIGTGHSSLANLKRLSVDMLKIDRTFIRDLEVDADDAAITRAIIQIGLSLDLTVVAEGVETPGQVEFLRKHQCQQAQGYLYSKALSAEALKDWILNGCATAQVSRSSVNRVLVH
ncbi:MAG: EAL domain-containing protein [Gammaproteobacteria bacterium]|nr:EAL domain-containing protein [Gammaproteobacteria bacterium]